MSIKDITLSSNDSATNIPTPPPMEEILQYGTQSPISQDLMSGSILKILSENGFKHKIEEGYTKGHKYTILHSAPSNDFTLVDTWNETTVDETGNTVTVPRKKYQVFTIATPAPAPVVAPTNSSEISIPKETVSTVEAFTVPPESTVFPTDDALYQTVIESNVPPVDPTPTIEPVSTTDTVMSTHETLTDIPTVTPSMPEVDALRAKSIAEKIKKGGAGMTPEDWQFRNENWPLIEAQLAPKTVVSPVVTPSVGVQPLEITASEPAIEEVTVTEQTPTEPEPAPFPTDMSTVHTTAPESPTVLESPTTSTQTVDVTTFNTSEVSPPQTPSDQGNPKLIPQHYDSREWLIKKLKRTPDQVTSVTATDQSGNTPVTSAKISSYDLLKKRFAQNKPTENRPVGTIHPSAPTANDVTPINSTPTNPHESSPTTRTPTIEMVPDAQTRKKNLLDSLFGAELPVWEIVKTIPARAFIYPSEYAWGTDDQGRIIEKTLEDYPLSARKFREKIAQAIEEVATQGTPIETIPTGDVVDIIFNKGIL